MTAGRAIDAAYANYAQWKGWDGACDTPEKAARYYAAEFAGIALAGRRVLEIGFGNGAFLAWAKAQGAQVSGIELSEEMRAAARAHGFEIHDGDFDALAAAQAGRYDVVVAFDVLEHWDTDELFANMRDIRALLAEGGIFLARFPNGQSPYGRAFQHGDFTHKSALTTYKIEYLAAAMDLRVVRVANPCRVSSRPGLLPALRQRWMAFRRSRIERSIARLYGMRRLPLDPNLVVVLRKPAADEHSNGNFA